MFELIVTLGDRQVQKYRGSGNVVSIGRDPSCDVCLDNLGVSRVHAEIRQIEGRYVLADKGSTNGIYMGDRRITSTELSAGDTFRIAKFSLRFRPVEREAPQSFDINQTIAMNAADLGAGGKVAEARPEFVASVTRDVFHRKGCAWIKATPDDHKVWFNTAQEAWDSGRRPCKTCDPTATEPSPQEPPGQDVSRESARPETSSGSSRPESSSRSPRPESTAASASEARPETPGQGTARPEPPKPGAKPQAPVPETPRPEATKRPQTEAAKPEVSKPVTPDADDRGADDTQPVIPRPASSGPEARRSGKPTADSPSAPSSTSDTDRDSETVLVDRSSLSSTSDGTAGSAASDASDDDGSSDSDKTPDARS